MEVRLVVEPGHVFEVAVDLRISASAAAAIGRPGAKQSAA
jgi:hypothetical protein